MRLWIWSIQKRDRLIDRVLLCYGRVANTRMRLGDYGFYDFLMAIVGIVFAPILIPLVYIIYPKQSNRRNHETQ